MIAPQKILHIGIKAVMLCVIRWSLRVSEAKKASNFMPSNWQKPVNFSSLAVYESRDFSWWIG